MHVLTLPQLSRHTCALPPIIKSTGHLHCPQLFTERVQIRVPPRESAALFATSFEVCGLRDAGGPLAPCGVRVSDACLTARASRTRLEGVGSVK